jgi:hypothetical protein
MKFIFILLFDDGNVYFSSFEPGIVAHLLKAGTVEAEKDVQERSMWSYHCAYGFKI